MIPIKLNQIFILSLSINWVSACRVFEYVHIFRCYQCGGFGHDAEECESVKVYVKCSSPGHTQQNCDTLVFKCRNCEDTNHRLTLNLDINHLIYVINILIFFKKQNCT